MIVRVLGIDVASADWASNGSATLSFDLERKKFEQLHAPAIMWPSCALTPESLASAIDEYARRDGVRVVALDGPQGWRHPSTPEGAPGVGRRCEYECRAQGKTGVYPTTFPANQRAWIEFCVDLFAELLDKPCVVLADSPKLVGIPADGYIVLECYPTSAWRSSGLKPLPGKTKKPIVDGYLTALTSAYALPAPSTVVRTHDDMQAVVAAVVAAAVAGGPARGVSRGIPSAMSNDPSGRGRRLEGLIWNVEPLTGARAVTVPAEGTLQTVLGEGEIRVTQRVLDQVARLGAHQSQIAIRTAIRATKTSTIVVEVSVDGEEYKIVVGDTHAAWRSHQTDSTRDSFERLFAILADKPNQWWALSHCRVLENPST